MKVIVSGIVTLANCAVANRASEPLRKIWSEKLRSGIQSLILPLVILVTLTFGCPSSLLASCGGSTVCTSIADFSSCLATSGNTCVLSNTCSPVANVNSCPASNVWEILGGYSTTDDPKCLTNGAACITELRVTGNNVTVKGQGSGSTTTTLLRGEPYHNYILYVGPSVSNVTVQNLTFDGNNQLWNWQNSHANLKYFLQTASGNAYWHEVHIVSATATVSDVTFQNSTRVSLFFGGPNTHVIANTFRNGLDVGISAFGTSATSLEIESNVFGDTSVPYGYRGGGIGLYYSTGT